MVVFDAAIFWQACQLLFYRLSDATGSLAWMTGPTFPTPMLSSWRASGQHPWFHLEFLTAHQLMLPSPTTSYPKEPLSSAASTTSWTIRNISRIRTGLIRKGFWRTGGSVRATGLFRSGSESELVSGRVWRKSSSTFSLPEFCSSSSSAGMRTRNCRPTTPTSCSRPHCWTQFRLSASS